MADCIFCKIVKGEIPSAKIWEDPNHMAILDINPNTEGMTLVLTKDHFDSDATDMPEKERMSIEAFKNLDEAIETAEKYPDLTSVIYNKSGKIVFEN